MLVNFDGADAGVSVCQRSLSNTPLQALNLLNDPVFMEAAQALPRVRLRGHFHNTRNCGLANAYAACEAGAVALDASVGGIGSSVAATKSGCPS